MGENKTNKELFFFTKKLIIFNLSLILLYIISKHFKYIILLNHARFKK